MKPTLKELILKECYELTKHYVFLHEWFRIFCLNFQVPIIKTLIGAHTLVRHSIREPYNFNLFYSDIDLTFILENENKIRNVLKRLHILKYFMPNIGEPEILLVNEYQNIISHQSSLYRTIGQKIFQVRKLTWQYNKLSQSSNPYEISKIHRGIEKTLNRLNTQTNCICLESIFPNCPKSKKRLNLNYPFFSDYLECWIEIGECTKELSIICPNIEMADAFLQFIPGNKYEDQSLNHQGLKKYLSYFEIGKSMATFRTKKLEPKEHAQGIAWLETLNKQINEINKDNRGEVITDIEESTLPCFIIASYGDTPSRRQALLTCIKTLFTQTAKFNVLHVDLTFGEKKSDVIDDSSYFRLEIQGKDRNKDLWQKEALWNVGAKFVKNAKILFFIDGDILPRSPVWASEIIRIIESDKNQIIQCFSHFQDSLPGSPMIPSWMSEYYFNHKTPSVAPGLAWAMSREAYLGLGGINAIFPEGSADTAFVYELFGIKKGMPDWFLNSLRTIDHSYKITSHNAVLTHINHGKDRNYNNRCKIVDFNRMNLSSILHIDQQGLLSWNSTNPLIRNVFSVERKLEVLSTADGLQLLKDLKSAGLIHIPKHSTYQTKTALEYIRTKQNDFAIITEHDDELNEIKCYSFNKGLRSAELMAQNVLADGEGNIIDIEIFFPQKTNIEFKIVEYGGDYKLIKYSKKFSNRFIYRKDISHQSDQVNYLQLIFRFQFESHCSIKYRIKVERR